MTLPPHPSSLPLDQLLKACQVTHTRASGPGGQHRNKVQTAVVLTHSPTGISAQASERRAQAENLKVATFRLRINLALQHRAHAFGPPSPLWTARCQSERIACSPSHIDFPTLLAEALDTLTHFNFDHKAAAEHLNLSASQLIKFLKKEPRAFQLINTERAAHNLHPLK
ncbi:peptide chain release factor-like protein [Poriferisphaera sp. WC338]|uniref:peptide chain release factor-like protein n=1 Tax=Poriferisphaera sp. WC338 TaxID=3425129 RepID=UPI003D815D78